MSSSSGSGGAAPPHVVEDCRGVLQVLSDGTIIRSSTSPFFIPTPDGTAVEWKDIKYSTTHNLHLRLYRPRTPLTPNLPILYYFHGGGFCIGSRTWPNFHACCLRLAAEIPAVVVSPDYRLAPEHRLPAAIDDGFTAVQWLCTDCTPDPWISDTADLTRVFISGESAGGTIAHHLAVRFGSAGPDPTVRVRGYLLSMPAFSGTKMTRSEEEDSTDSSAFLTMEMAERYWRLAMPLGATADDPMVSPFAEEAPSMEAAELAPMVVVVAGGDVLRDRDVGYARRLQEWGKPVELVEFPGQQHAFFTVDPWSGSADELVKIFKRFVEKKN